MTERSSGYYARIMGTFWRHPRTSSLTLAARGLWVSLLSWCADQRSDGEIPAHVVQMVGAADRRVDAYRRELESVGLLTIPRAGMFQLRDWEQHNITRAEHDNAKDRAKNGMANKRATERAVTPPVTRNSQVTTEPRSIQPSDQEQEQEHSRSTERESRARAPESRDVTPGHATEADDLHHAIDTGAAERNRKAIVAAYRAHAPAVPRRALSLAGRADDTAAMAGMSEVALPGILARFFGDRDMKAKGWPVGHLLANPAQWGETATGWKRDEGAPRVRPLEDEVPPWVLAEREREAEHG